MKKNFMPIFTFAFLIVGFFSASACLYMGWKTSRFLREAVPGSGKIVRMDSNYDSHHANVFSPIVSFIGQDGASHEFTGKSWTSSRNWKDGKVIPVLYRPSQPSDARIQSFYHLWFSVLVTGFVGLVFSAVAGAVLVKGIYRGKQIGANQSEETEEAESLKLAA